MFHVNPEPGARIHDTDPFATPDSDRSPIRRMRGRLANAVTLWTAGGDGSTAMSDGSTGMSSGNAGVRVAPAGLTVSSMLVADGEPGRVLGLVDEESDFWEAASVTGRFAVATLSPTHRQLADQFAGLFPAPGGLFATGEWTSTGYGPVPADAGAWMGCRLDASREYGWSLLVEATVELVELVGESVPMVYHRGRYRGLAG
ncbi:flavin reductase family protein [Micromonospora sp. NPDC050417]|uniref:flavin reductase family protein n=1 Tax=Micromonospora sp. NPDC050417 TaxID=3364280 RepID=UPI00379FF5FC